MTESRECVQCRRPTRPPRTRIVDAPGTVTRANRDLCNTCYSRRYKTGDVGMHRPAVKVSALCARCGFERKHIGTNSSTLCGDCRLVLSKEEQKLWAA